MTDVPVEGERRYSEEEFALILRRVQELQDDRPGVDFGDGFSIAEIRAIAREVGLDPELVTRAASALPTRRRGRLTAILGGPDSYQLNTSYAGEISREDFGKVVEVIRAVTEHQGEVEEVLDGLEWSTVGQLSQIHVTVRPRDGRTSVGIIVDRSPAALLTYFMSGLAWLVATGATGAAIDPGTLGGGLAIVAAGASGWFLTARTIWKATTNTFRSRLSDLADALGKAMAQRPGP